MLTDTAILPIPERLLFLAIKYYNYCVQNTSHLAHFALRDSIQLSTTARHSWHGSFTKSLAAYGIPLPTSTTNPIDLLDARKWMESSVLGDVKLRVSEMSRLSIHHDTPFTWKRKPYTNLEYRLAAAIASLRSSMHFPKGKRLRKVDAARRIERQNRRCPQCPEEVEDERHALLVYPVFGEEREKWRIRLRENGVVCSDEEMFKLCLDPSGKKEVVFYTAVFVKTVLKIVRRRYTTGGR
ncbi:hypothetical protein FPQ18DRAFT_307450 [Pyronema domesticum]|nr:hypothetical protein FPQ18DRAFT_307450 [Pyronema domesticum]